MKTCSRCRVKKPADDFGVATHRKDGLRPRCRECENENNRRHYAEDAEARAKAYVRTSAWKRANPEVGRAAVARWRKNNIELVRERKRAEWAANGEQIALTLKDAAYRRKYGISLDERNALAETQGHRCALCGLAENENHGRRLAVDHHHGTGTVRALLCGNCNSGLGHFGDDPDRLRLAIAYLEHHAERKEVTV